MNIYSLSLLGFSFGTALIAFLGYVKKPDIISLRYILFSISVFGWGFCTALWITQSYDYESSLFFSRISHTFAVFIPITWLHFVHAFLNKKNASRLFYFFCYGLACFLAAISHTPAFVSGLHSIHSLTFYTSPGPTYIFYVGFFFALVPIGFYELVKKLLSLRGEDSLSLKSFIAATIIGFSSGSLLFLPVYKIDAPLGLLSMMLLYPAFMGVALIRHGLFDTREITDAFQREKLAALGMISASLNHELRNPLYVAKGRMESYMDAVDRDLFPSVHEKIEKAEGVMTSALHQLTRAMEIMQRFSDFAKPRSAGFVEKEKVELNETVDDVLKLVSKEFEMKGIKVSEKPEEAISVRANRRQLEEILFNLVVNACHAMGDKGGELAIKANQPNGKVCVEVSDTGAGIAKENQKRIFEPFYTTKAGKGTGLGLYITKQLVERNGGKIAVKSKPGVGTRFILEFQPA